MLNPNDFIGDRSNAYFWMCKQSSEVQSLRKDQDAFEFNAGDYYVEDPASVVLERVTELKRVVNAPLAVWVPTTNQLMDLFSSGSAIEVFSAITDHWRKEVPYLLKINEQSAEQLLLAWFMRQRYMKKWNGHFWEKDMPIQNEESGV